MIPFHKIYLKLFQSLDFNLENDLLKELEQDGIAEFFIIKRSWFYGVKVLLMGFIPMIFLLLNGFLSIYYFESIFVQYILSISFFLIALVLFYYSIRYLFLYKKIHGKTSIETDIKTRSFNSRKINRFFIKFFNITVLANVLLLVVLLETIIFTMFFYQGEHIILLITEIILTIPTYFIIIKYRRLIMNLQLDFGLVIKRRFYNVDQVGLLSSKQSIVGRNIKTVEGSYPSIIGSLLGYGDIKIFLDGNVPDHEATIHLDHIQNPRQAVDYINKTIQ